MKQIACIIGSIMLAGCAVPQPGTSVSSIPTPIVRSTSPIATQSVSPLLLTPGSHRLDVFVQRAVADLAGRLSIDPASIQVGQVGADEFPAQGLGCANAIPVTPVPDQPAFVIGGSVQLLANNLRYEYRGHGDQIVFCGLVSP